MQKGFVLGWILVVVAILGTVAAAYYYLHNKPSFSPQITSFDECKKVEGSKIQESYPAVCVTQDGQRFMQQVDPKTVRPD